MRKKSEIMFHPLSNQNIQQISTERASLGERAADITTNFMGSWFFIGLTFLFFIIWFGFNLYTPIKFDPAPFLILNLSLGIISAFQAPILIISQSVIDRKNHIRTEIQYNKIDQIQKDIEELKQKHKD